MSDALLASTDVEEMLSEAYVSAIAAAAGYSVGKTSLDRDSVDLTISAGGLVRPKLDIQLKASINVKIESGQFPFFCKKKNYDDLRAETQTPRILVVLHLPNKQEDWLSVSVDELVIRNCAYWICLQGHPETDNASGKTVYIQAANRFDVQSLKALMAQSRSGKIV